MPDASLSRLTHDIVQDTYKTLHALLDSLSDSNDEEQKRRKLIDFFLHMRHRFARLLVIVRWFMSYSAFHGSAQSAKDLALTHSQFYTNDADTLYWKLNNVKFFQSLPCALPEATEILTNFSFNRLPHIITSSIGIDFKSLQHSNQFNPDKFLKQLEDNNDKDNDKDNDKIMVDKEKNDQDNKNGNEKEDENDEDEDSLTHEALHRLKLYTKRIVNECLPSGIQIIQQQQPDNNNNKNKQMKNISIKIGIENIWTADLILDSLKQDEMTNLRLLEFEIFVDSNPDAPTQMYNRKRMKERKLPLQQSQIMPLRQMIDDRMKWSALSIHDFHKRMKVALLTLCITMSLECCGNIAMSHIREQVGAMMIMKQWRESEINIIGRWIDVNTSTNDNNINNNYNIIKKKKYSNKQPVQIEYWKQSYLKSKLILNIYNDHYFMNKIKNESIDLITDNKKNSYSIEHKWSSHDKYHYYSSSSSSLHSSLKSSTDVLQKIVNIQHEPELPSIKNNKGIYGDFQLMSTNKNNVELNISSINVQELLLESGRTRANIEFEKINKEIKKMKTKYTISTKLVNYGTSCSGITFSFCGGGGEHGVGLIIGMSLTSGGVFVRVRGSVEIAVKRMDDIGKELRKLLWKDEIFFRNEKQFVSTIMNIVHHSAVIAWKEAMTRSIYASGGVALTTWLPGRTFLERPIINTDSRTMNDDKDGNDNDKDRISPPFVAIEKKRPRAFMTLDSIGDYVYDGGTNMNYHSNGGNRANIGSATKRARITNDNNSSNSNSDINSMKYNGLGLTGKRIGDFNFIQGQLKHPEKQHHTENNIPDIKTTGGMMNWEMSAYGMAEWAEMRHEMRVRMLRERLLTMLLDQGVISSWKGREEDEEEADIEDQIDDEEDEFHITYDDNNNNNINIENDNDLVMTDANQKYSSSSSSLPSLFGGNNNNTKISNNIQNFIRFNRVNEAKVELRGQPLEVERAFVKVLENEGWVLEVRLRKDVFTPSGVYGSESCYRGDVDMELTKNENDWPKIKGEDGNDRKNENEKDDGNKRRRGRRRVLQFWYGGVNGNCVRSCIREVMRARAAATLGMGLTISFNDKNNNNNINNINNNNKINNNTNINTNNNNHTNNNGNGKYRVIEWTHRYVLVECFVAGFQDRVYLHVGLGSTTIEVEIWPKKGEAIDLIKSEVIPLIEEVLSESRKQMGHCLQAILTVTIPMAISVEKAINNAISTSHQYYYKKNRLVRVKFITVLRARIVFSNGHHHTNNSTSNNNNNNNNNNSNSSNNSSNNNSNNKRKHYNGVFGLDIDGHRLNGQIILTDVGSARKYRNSQNSSSNSTTTTNPQNDLISIPTWKAVVERLREKKLANVSNQGTSLEMKIELLYKVVHAILKSVIVSSSSSSSASASAPVSASAPASASASTPASTTTSTPTQQQTSVQTAAITAKTSAAPTSASASASVEK